MWFVNDSNIFPSFAIALRIVVLSQLSSCAVERAFSILKAMRDKLNDNTLEDMAEIRMFLECNGELEALLS